MLPFVCSVQITDDGKMWKEQKNGTRSDSQVCQWCSCHILKSSVIYYWTDARQHGIYRFYIITKETTTDKALSFCFKIFQLLAKAGLCPVWRRRKKAIRRNLLSCKMKQSHWLLCVAKYFDGSRKIMPLSNLTRAAQASLLLGMKTYNKSRIELRNLQILKKMLASSSQFLSSTQSCGPKSLDFALNIARVEKIPSGNFWLRST